MRPIWVLLATTLMVSACGSDGEPRLHELYGTYIHTGDFNPPPKIFIEPDGMYRFTDGNAFLLGVWTYKNGYLSIKAREVQDRHKSFRTDKINFFMMDPFSRDGSMFLRFDTDEVDIYKKVDNNAERN